MTKTLLKWILVVSVVLRVIAALYLGNEVVPLPGTHDQVSYHTLALRVLTGHGFTFEQSWWPLTAAGEPTAHWSYLYTMYLTAVYAIFGPHPLAARLIQAVIVGLLQPYLAYRIAWHMFGRNAVAERGTGGGNLRDSHPGTFEQATVPEATRIALAAAGVTAIYVYFIYYAATLMTESFFIVSVMASLLWVMSLASRITEPGYRKVAVTLGVMLGVAVLLRQLILLLAPFLFLWLVLATLKTRLWSRMVLSIGLASLTVCLFILPFTIFNYIRFDSFVLLNTNAGYVLYWANHPIYGTQFKSAAEMSGAYGDLVPPELRSLDEAALDRELLRRGVQFVLDDPHRYLLLTLSRIPAYFKFWPEPASGTISNLARVASFGLFLPFMLYGLVRSFVRVVQAGWKGLSKQPFCSYLLLYLFLTVYSAIHLLTWSQIRYRMPVDAVLVLFAAVAVTELGMFLRQNVINRPQNHTKRVPAPIPTDKG